MIRAFLELFLGCFILYIYKYKYICCNGGPKLIGRQKQKLCRLVFGWQSTGYKEVLF